MAEVFTRAIPAPQQEWLTRRELAAALDLGEKYIGQLIKAGRFPRGTPWDGKELRWPWWVVVWFRYSKALEPLLQAGAEDDDDPPGPDEAGKPPRR